MVNNEPIILGREVLTKGVFYETKAALISKSDFEILIQSKTNWLNLSLGSLGAFIGLFVRIIVICVLVANKDIIPLNNLTNKPEDFIIDLYCAIIFLITAIIFYVINCLTKGAKDELVKEIRTYFK